MPIFLPVAWMRRMFFTWAKDVDIPGAGHVARSSVGIIMTLLLARGFLGRRIHTTSVARRRKDSRLRTTVQEDIVAIVIRGGDTLTICIPRLQKTLFLQSLVMNYI